ncbi:MAG: YtxH domain-containing protein [Anaerolineae bacterium]|nr:YtxH domain-containing protein [Anaerolineae bacterium]
MAKQPQWRKLLNIEDVGDVLALVNTFRELLSRKERELEREGRQTAQRVGKDIRQSQTFETAMEIGSRLSKLVARKRRELKQTGEELKKTGEEAIIRAEKETIRAAQNVQTVVEQDLNRREPVRQDNGEMGLFVIGAIAGTVIGAIVAIWFAPQSGEATRHDIEQAANEARQKIEGESVSDAIQAGKAEARRFQETADVR